MRTVKCGSENGNFVSDFNCNKLQKPAFEMECENTKECERHLKEYIQINVLSTPAPYMYKLVEKWSMVLFIYVYLKRINIFRHLTFPKLKYRKIIFF
jgi:hypothetical protein